MRADTNSILEQIAHNPKRRAELFRSGLDRLVEIITRYGGKKTEVATQDLRYFTALSDEEQLHVVTNVATTLGACDEMIAGGLNPRIGGPLAWRVLMRMGYQIQSDAFQGYHDGDVVEIYNSRHKQVFASLNMLEASSYSLEDLYTRPWIELWHRSDEVNQQLYDKAMYVTSGACSSTLHLEIPFHLVEERYSAKKMKGYVRPKMFSPVKDKYGEYGFLSVNEFQIIS